MSEFSDRIVPLLRRGVSVWSEDREELGYVAEVQRGWFRVRGHGPGGFWLPVDAVDEVQPDRIILLLPAAWVPDCASSHPRAA